MNVSRLLKAIGIVTAAIIFAYVVALAPDVIERMLVPLFPFIERPGLPEAVILITLATIALLGNINGRD